MKTLVAIPTLCESDLFIPLVDELLEQDEFDQLLIFDDRRDCAVGAEIGFLKDSRVLVLPTGGIRNHSDSFYELWNAAIRRAGRLDGRANVVLLNDDIKIPKHFISRLTEALREDDDAWCTYPNYNMPIPNDRGCEHRLIPTRGTLRNGGLWGCAFALRAELYRDGELPLISEQFRIWCGDDDLVKQIDLAGKKVCRVDDLALEHHASTTFQKHPELHAIGWEDVERFKAKYGAEAW